MADGGGEGEGGGGVGEGRVESAEEESVEDIVVSHY